MNRQECVGAIDCTPSFIHVSVTSRSEGLFSHQIKSLEALVTDATSDPASHMRGLEENESKKQRRSKPFPIAIFFSATPTTPAED